jgi:phage repressor protein C with HTH and peptisase S24 domain
MDEVAKRLGMKGRSSVQRFFVPHLDELGPVDALRLADAFEGEGEPPITKSEVVSLCSYPLAEVRPNETPAPRYMQLPRDVPVYGTAMGTFREGGEGQDIEEAFVDRSEIIEHFARPPGYATKPGLYGLYVTGSSMEPRWESGDPLYVDPKRPPQIGDDIVVYLKHPEGDVHELEAVLLKRLVRVGATFLELEQYNPAAIFRIDRKRISAFHRVIPQRELLAFH